MGPPSAHPSIASSDSASPPDLPLESLAAAGKRRKHDKVKSGCNTCKYAASPHGALCMAAKLKLQQRRIKCDETKPACRRCTSTGRQCGGYTPLPKPPKPFQVKAWRHTTLGDPKPGPLSTRPDMKPGRDMQSLEYLVQQTMPYLIGFYPAPPWAQALLAGAESDAILRHGLLALSLCHRSRTEAQSENAVAKETLPLGALRHYNQAIQLLRKALAANKLSAARVRLATLPLILFESLQRNMSGMKMHLWNSLALEEPSPAATSPISPVSSATSSLSPVSSLSSWAADTEDPASDFLSRFTLFFTLYGRPRSDLLTQQMPQPRIAARYDTDDEMHTTFEAQMQITNIAIREMQVTRAYVIGLVPAGVDMHSSVRLQLTAWAERYRRFEERYPVSPDDDDAKAGRALLWVYHSLGRVLLEAMASPATPMYDRYTEDFRHMVDLLEYILVQRRSPSDGQLPKMAPVDGGLIMPLMYTALKCREPDIRRRAIALLHQCPRTEGVWDADESILLAETVAAFEAGTLRPAATASPPRLVFDVDVIEQPAGDKAMVLWVAGHGHDDFELPDHPSYCVRVRAVGDRQSFLQTLRSGRLELPGVV